MENNRKKLTNKELLRLIVDELAGIIVTDINGRYVYVNNRWSSLTGLSLLAVKGKFVRDVVSTSRVDYVLQTRRFVSGDAILKNAYTGNEVPVYCSYVPLFQEGNLVGCFVYMIQKSETAPLDVPTNATQLMESLDFFLKQLEHRNTKYSLDGIIGESPCMKQLKTEILSAARSGSTVLIEGETGSGKELVAHSIHNLSLRKNNEFIKVNCSSIPFELMESEFFGYENGAFTGAKKGGNLGKFEKANGGSLFLDEINQLPLQLQPKFLRVLQEHEIEKIGSSSSIPIDVRIIAATNVPLSQLVSKGLFRTDLYYRLNILRLRVPPLRERKEDIPEIAKYILRQLNYQLQIQIPYIENEALERLMQYHWPGNVRELHNVIERAMNISWTDPLQWKHFSGYFDQLEHRTQIEQSVSPSAANTLPLHSKLQEKKSTVEKDLILDALIECNGNKSLAAQKLGISRTILYKKMHKYNIF